MESYEFIVLFYFSAPGGSPKKGFLEAENFVIIFSNIYTKNI